MEIEIAFIDSELILSFPNGKTWATSDKETIRVLFNYDLGLSSLDKQAIRYEEIVSKHVDKHVVDFYLPLCS